MINQINLMCAICQIPVYHFCACLWVHSYIWTLVRYRSYVICMYMYANFKIIFIFEALYMYAKYFDHIHLLLLPSNSSSAFNLLSLPASCLFSCFNSQSPFNVGILGHPLEHEQLTSGHNSIGEWFFLPQ